MRNASNQPITFKIVDHGTSEYETLVALRQEVLRTPLGLFFTKDELEKEKEHIHIIALLNDEMIATAGLVIESNSCKMRQVAVSKKFQGQGLGSLLMNFCEKYAKEKGIPSIYCHARHHVVPFYEKNGYVCEGDDFNEVGIIHTKMRKNL